MTAADDLEDDPLGADAVRREDRSQVALEDLRAAFRADEQEPRVRRRRDDPGPGLDDLAVVLVRIVGGAEGDVAVALDRRLRHGLRVFAEGVRAHGVPSLGQHQRLLDHQRPVFRRHVRIEHQVVDFLQAGRVRIAHPARRQRGGLVGHHPDLVHVGRAAEFDQHVELVVGDHLRGVAVGDLRDPAELVHHARDRLLRLVFLALVVRVAIDLEAIAVVVLEQRQGEVGDRVAAQVRGHEADADLAVRSPRRGMCDGPPGDGLLDLAAPDAVLFDQFQPILGRVGARQVGEERGVTAGLGPGAADLREGPQLGHAVVVGDAGHQLVGDLEVGRFHRHARQHVHHDPIAALQVRGLVPVPRAPKAFGEHDVILHVVGGELDGFLEVGVRTRAIIVGDRGPELEVEVCGLGMLLDRFEQKLLGSARLAAAAYRDAAGFDEPQVVRAGRRRARENVISRFGRAQLLRHPDQVQPGVGPAGLQLGRQVEAGLGLLQIAGEPVCTAQGSLQVRVAGRLAHQLGEHVDGLRIAQVVVDVAEVVQDQLVLGVQLRGAAQGRQRLVIAVQAAQRDAADVPEIDVLGMAIDRLGRPGCGALVLFVTDQQGREVAIDVKRRLGIFPETGLDQRHTFFDATGLEGGLRGSESLSRHTRVPCRAVGPPMRRRVSENARKVQRGRNLVRAARGANYGALIRRGSATSARGSRPRAEDRRCWPR